MRSRWGATAVSVYDGRTGETFVSEFGHLPIRSASVIKVPVLLSVLADHATLSDKERADAEAMIRRSDNNATSRFWKALGGPRVIDFIHRASGTRDSGMAPENSAWWGYSLVTAYDLCAVLSHLARPTSPLVTPAAREYVLSEMRQVVPDQHWGVPEAAADIHLDPATVAVKNGWYPEEDEKDWRVHTTGVVPLRGDGSVAMTVLTRYPIKLDMRYGQETCRRVCTEVLRGL